MNFRGNWTSLATSKTLVSVSSLRIDLIVSNVLYD